MTMLGASTDSMNFQMHSKSENKNVKYSDDYKKTIPNSLEFFDSRPRGPRPHREWFPLGG
jgi:hypothetical protein